MVALVRGVHGLRGAVRVEVLTDRPEARFVPGTVLFREGRDDPLTIASAEDIVDGPGWRIRFREVTGRDGADSLRGAYLEADLRPEDDLQRGAYYWHEVIGTVVRGVNGAELGTVEDIYRVGENEVFVVGGGPFGNFDVPAVRAFIRIFAPRRGEIVVDAEALDLQPSKMHREADRPKAPRRRRRGSPAAAEPKTPEPDGGGMTEPAGGGMTEPAAGDMTEPDGGGMTEPAAGGKTEPDGGGMTEPAAGDAAETQTETETERAMTGSGDP